MRTKRSTAVHHIFKRNPAHIYIYIYIYIHIIEAELRLHRVLAAAFRFHARAAEPLQRFFFPP